jgi:excisionase family DNA binding protein
MTTPSKWWDVATAATYLGIGRRSVYGAVTRGELRAVRLFAKRQIFTTAEWCDAFMLANATCGFRERRVPSVGEGLVPPVAGWK